MISRLFGFRIVESAFCNSPWASEGCPRSRAMSAGDARLAAGKGEPERAGRRRSAWGGAGPNHSCRVAATGAPRGRVRHSRGLLSSVARHAGLLWEGRHRAAGTCTLVSGSRATGSRHQGSRRINRALERGSWAPTRKGSGIGGNPGANGHVGKSKSVAWRRRGLTMCVPVASTRWTARNGRSCRTADRRSTHRMNRRRGLEDARYQVGVQP